MQACDASAAVATFSELDENADAVISTDAMQSCSTQSDLGISVWGCRYVWEFSSIQMGTCDIVYLY